MADAIAKYYGIQLVEVLTGFKFIGQKILEFEKTGKGTYLFGYGGKLWLSDRELMQEIKMRSMLP